MKRRIPIFLASDDNYIPYLAVTVKSIELHASDENTYDVKVLTSGLSKSSQDKLLPLQTDNLNIEIVNIEEKIKEHRGRINRTLRDYYSESIFYRIFIASLYPELDRAIYIDCDTVLVDDIAKLYDEELGDNILAGVIDESIPDVPEFVDYVTNWVGVSAEHYINSGVLVINLKEFRLVEIERKITASISRHDLETVAPDQDYLNHLCHGKIKYLPSSWNKQPKGGEVPLSELHLIHYNMFNKPWRYREVQYGDEFWRVARLTPFYDDIYRELQNYTDDKRARDGVCARLLVENAARLASLPSGFQDKLNAGKHKV